MDSAPTPAQADAQRIADALATRDAEIARLQARILDLEVELDNAAHDKDSRE